MARSWCHAVGGAGTRTSAKNQPTNYHTALAGLPQAPHFIHNFAGTCIETMRLAHILGEFTAPCAHRLVLGQGLCHAVGQRLGAITDIDKFVKAVWQPLDRIADQWPTSLVAQTSNSPQPVSFGLRHPS